MNEFENILDNYNNSLNKLNEINKRLDSYQDSIIRFAIYCLEHPLFDHYFKIYAFIYLGYDVY